jgi:hypothetical protein
MFVDGIDSALVEVLGSLPLDYRDNRAERRWPNLITARRSPAGPAL